jgi:hypothetical protein
MGWEDFMVAAEYDGDQHRTDRPQYVKDLRVIPKLERLGWIIVRVIKEDRRDEVIQRAWDALVSRGWRPNRLAEIAFHQGRSRADSYGQCNIQ